MRSLKPAIVVVYNASSKVHVLLNGNWISGTNSSCSSMSARVHVFCTGIGSLAPVAATVVVFSMSSAVGGLLNGNLVFGTSSNDMEQIL